MQRQSINKSKAGALFTTLRMFSGCLWTGAAYAGARLQHIPLSCNTMREALIDQPDDAKSPGDYVALSIQYPLAGVHALKLLGFLQNEV